MLLLPAKRFIYACRKDTPKEIIVFGGFYSSLLKKCYFVMTTGRGGHGTRPLSSG
jgi:hypothetical protein